MERGDRKIREEVHSSDERSNMKVRLPKRKISSMWPITNVQGQEDPIPERAAHSRASHKSANKELDARSEVIPEDGEIRLPSSSCLPLETITSASCFTSCLTMSTPPL